TDCGIVQEFCGRRGLHVFSRCHPALPRTGGDQPHLLILAFADPAYNKVGSPGTGRREPGVCHFPPPLLSPKRKRGKEVSSLALRAKRVSRPTTLFSPGRWFVCVQ